MKIVNLDDLMKKFQLNCFIEVVTRNVPHFLHSTRNNNSFSCVIICESKNNFHVLKTTNKKGNKNRRISMLIKKSKLVTIQNLKIILCLVSRHSFNPFSPTIKFFFLVSIHLLEKLWVESVKTSTEFNLSDHVLNSHDLSN